MKRRLYSHRASGAGQVIVTGVEFTAPNTPPGHKQAENKAPRLGPEMTGAREVGGPAPDEMSEDLNHHDCVANSDGFATPAERSFFWCLPLPWEGSVGCNGRALFFFRWEHTEGDTAVA